MRLPVHEPLADNAFQRAFGALHVIYAKPDAIAITEVKFREIAVQMFFLAVLVHSFHAALEDRKITFNGVGRDDVRGVFRIADIFIGTVGYSVVRRKLFFQIVKVLAFIGIHPAFTRHICANDRHEIGNRPSIDVEATCRTAALNESENHILVRPSAPLRYSLNPTYEGFVGLDYFASATHRIRKSDNAHGLADAMRHEPCGFKRDAQSAMQLVRANPFLGRAKQIDRLQPQPHWDVTILENGSDLHRELLAAVVALVKSYPGAFAAHLRDAISRAAVRANRTIGPQPSLNPSIGGGLVLESFGIEDGFRHDTRFPMMEQGYHEPVGLLSITSPNENTYQDV
jgi:hypothetical protein